MMSRYKPVGWRGESHRHYLAAKGVKTHKYKALKVSKEEKQKYGAFVDNPNEDRWLQGEIENGPTSSVTAGTQKAVFIDVDKALEIPGHNQEEGFIDTSESSKFRIDAVTKSIKKSGFDEEARPLIGVTRDRGATVFEGNHRIRAAKKAGLKKIPVEFRWYNGSEEIGKDSFDNVIRKKKYMAVKWNTEGKEVEWIAPEEYLKRSGHSSPEQFERSRPREFLDKETGKFQPVAKLVEKFKNDDIRVDPLESQKGEGGRHRAYAAYAAGIKKVPVLK